MRRMRRPCLILVAPQAGLLAHRKATGPAPNGARSDPDSARSTVRLPTRGVRPAVARRRTSGSDEPHPRTQSTSSELQLRAQPQTVHFGRFDFGGWISEASNPKTAVQHPKWNHWCSLFIAPGTEAATRTCDGWKITRAIYDVLATIPNPSWSSRTREDGRDEPAVHRDRPASGEPSFHRKIISGKMYPEG